MGDYPSEAGLFGPASVAWRVHGDPSTVVGGMRALLMQALNPLAMAGVDDHSDYRDDPWGRFGRTASFITTATFGTRAEAEALGARIKRIHASVKGLDRVTGAHYSADDPELLVWVHNVLVDSLLAAKRHYGGGLNPVDADRYLEEMVVMAELVGTPPSLVATDTVSLARYIDTAPLVASPAAQQAKWAVLSPPLPLALRPLWAVLDAAAVGLLPSRVRRLYGLDWLAPAAPMVKVAIGVLLGAVKVLRGAPPPKQEAEARWAAWIEGRGSPSEVEPS